MSNVDDVVSDRVVTGHAIGVRPVAPHSVQVGTPESAVIATGDTFYTFYTSARGWAVRQLGG